MTCNPQPAMIQKYVTQMPRRVATNVAMQRRLATKCIFIQGTVILVSALVPLGLGFGRV